MGQSWVTEGVCQQKGFACAAKHLMELSDNKEPSLKCPAVKRVGGNFAESLRDLPLDFPGRQRLCY